MSDTVATISVAICMLGGSLVFFFTIVAMLRAPDSLSKLNVFSSATAFALPLLVSGAMLAQFHRTGVDGPTLALVVLIVVSFLVVPTLATYVLGRVLVDYYECGPSEGASDTPASAH